MEDAVALVELADERDVARNLADRFPHPYTPQDAHEWLLRQSDADPETNFAIELEGSLAGAVGLELRKAEKRHTGEIGYWIAKPLWGRGVASSVVAAFTEWAFQTFDLERIEAGVFEGNVASMRVLEKAGYTLEGRHRRAVCKEEKMLDLLMYARLRDEG